MQPVPTDLILHALAENLIGMEGDNASLCTLGHVILNSCVDPRALPAQWCNGAGVGQQMSWLTRRIVDEDTNPHVAAETRAMEVAISRRLADTAFSLLVTQDDSNKTAALTLLEASHRIVGLPSAEDTASWQSRVLALEGQIKAAVDTKDAWALEANLRTHLAEKFEAELKGAAVSLLHMHKERDALQAKLTEALADAAAHFEDVKTARDESDVLRTKLRQEEAKVLDLEADVERLAEAEKRADLYRDHMHEVRAALGILTIKSHSETINRIADIRNVDSSRPACERLTWIARFNNGNGGASLTLDGRTVLVIGKMADDLAEALHPRRRHVTDLKDKVAMFERDAWMPWARNILGVDDGTARELQGLIAKKVNRAEAISQQNLTRHDIIESIVAALKLDPGASKYDVIKVIESLQADRAKLCALVCGDNDKTVDAPVDAPKFKIGDRVIVFDNDDRMYAVKFDNSGDTGSCDAIVAEYNLRPLPKVDP